MILINSPQNPLHNGLCDSEYTGSNLNDRCPNCHPIQIERLPFCCQFYSLISHHNFVRDSVTIGIKWLNISGLL